MARPKTQLNRKTDILNAAQELFAEKSFEKTTIDEIAKNVGISKGSVYLDFKNKDQILLALAERHVLFLTNKLEAQVNSAEAPYLELLRQIFKNHVINVYDMAFSHMQSHVSLIHTSYHIKQELNYLVEKWFINIASILEKAEQNGEIKPYSDYKKLAQLIQISLQGFFPPYDLKYSHNHRTDLKKDEIRTLLLEDVSTVIEIILSGLKNTQNVKDYSNEA